MDDKKRALSLGFWAVAAVAGPAALFGCAGSPTPDGDGQNEDMSATNGVEQSPGPEHAEDIEGTLLYQLELGPGHTIEYYLMDGSHRAAREIMPIGAAEPVLNRLPDAPLSLAGIYRMARPDTEIPEEILEVDELYPPEELGDQIPESVATVQTTSVDVAANDTVGVLPAAALNAAAHCDDDLLGDNWGDQWFLDNFCQGGNHRWCQTNRTSGYIEISHTRLVRWSVMAADFHHGGWLKEQHKCNHIWSNSPPGPAWSGKRSIWVDPRTIQTWVHDEPWGCTGFPSGTCGQGYMDVKLWASPDSGCPRLHYAARWL